MSPIRLSEKEADILSCAQLQAHAPSRLSAQCGHSVKAVRYCLNKMLARRVIQSHPFIDISPLGYTQHTMFFSLNSQAKDKKDQLIKLLVESEKVSWVARLSGDYQYGVSICARSGREVAQFLDYLSGKFRDIFYEKEIAVLVSLTHFRMKYLSDRQPSMSHLSLTESGTGRETIDELDHTILRSLAQCGGRIVFRDIARRIGIPPSTLEYRIQNLEAKKILLGFTYLADTWRLGLQMYLLLLHMKGITKEPTARIYDFCVEHRNVNFFLEYIGSWDYAVGVEVEHSGEVISIVEELNDLFGENTNKIWTFQIFDCPKVSKYPFLGYDKVAWQY